MRTGDQQVYKGLNEGKLPSTQHSKSEPMGIYFLCILLPVVAIPMVFLYLLSDNPIHHGRAGKCFGFGVMGAMMWGLLYFLLF